MIEHLENRTLLSSYFVSASGGSDDNDGGELTPFASVAKVNELALQPGDAVLFRAGETFNGSLQFDSGDAGSASLPVIVGSYGSDGAGRATINAGNNPGILAVNAAGLEITNLSVVGAGQAPATHSGIEFRNTLSGDVKLQHVRVADVDVSGFGDYGIEIVGTADKSGFRDVRIERVAVHHNTHGGIGSTGRFDNTSSGYAHEDVYVGHAEVYENPGWAGSPSHSGSGIVLSDVRNVTIERSESHHNGAQNTHVGGPVGIWVWDVDQAMIRRNESHHNLTNSTADGGGFDFDGGVTNSVMEHNYSHHNAGPGYGIYQFGGARPFHNNHVRYNLSIDDGRRNSYGAIDVWNGNGDNGIRDTHVYNNAAYASPSPHPTLRDRRGNPAKLGDPRALRFVSGTVGVTVRNNVFQTTQGAMLAQIDGRHTNLKLQGNNWWSSGAAFSLRAFGKAYASFNAYASGTGQEKLNGVVVGRSVDPKMASPSVVPTVGVKRLDALETCLDGFKLRSDSPLRQSQNAGLNLSIYDGTYAHPFVTKPVKDFFGNALPATGPHAIGAHQYA